MRVLAADDDPGILAVLERSLKGWGYETLTARDGAEAWSILKRSDAPRTAILDWDMPKLSGLEICRLLRSTPHGEEVYIVMLTGRQQKDDLIEALEAGADDFLSKPFHPRELQLRLAKGISFHASRGAAAAAQEPPRGTPPSGTVLGGKYRLEQQVGEGGMASVWIGKHLALGIDVAIKFMKPDVAETPDYASFEREARAIALLRSEHVVRVYDHGIAHDGSPYLVMDFISGESLGAKIDRYGPLPPHEVSSIVDQISRALTEAHARNIIHRDVKPENILLVDDPERPEGLAKLVDFGLARSRLNTETTDEGGFISGTPSYMSPEHLRAQVPPNPHLDMWGLAATAYAALTGTLAFDGETVVEIIQKICGGPPPVPSSVNPRLPPEIDAWFAKAFARKPEERLATPRELAETFTGACAAARSELVSLGEADLAQASTLAVPFDSVAPTERAPDASGGQ